MPLILGSWVWTGTGVGQEPPPPPPPDTTDTRPKGSAEWLWQKAVDRRAPEDIRRARQKFGVIPQDAAEVIAEVAARQVERGEADEQKRFDELLGELEIKRVDFESRYLEALGVMREQFIQQQKREDESLILLLMIAAAAA